MSNPLIAPRIETPKDPWAGVWIVEDIESIRRGIENDSWVDGTLGVVGAGLDGLALISDPIGVLLQYGASWIIEHVRPLSEALDWLAGDPASIAANAQTWRNVANELHHQAEEFGSAVRLDLSEWAGESSAAYRDRSGQQQQAIGALAEASETMAVITESAGFLIAAVRILVRDAIATLVSRLVVYAAEEVASWGAAIPLVVEQVTTLIGSWTAKIARWLKSLLNSLRNLLPAVRRIGDLIDEIKKVLNRIHDGKETAGALNRVKKRGAGPIKLFNLESVRDIAAKYGIDISGLSISLGRKSTRAVCGLTRPDGSIVLFPAGFRSEEDLAKTLAHEKFHHDELAAGKPYPSNDEEFSLFEDRAYAHEDQWWNNQPIRPEPRRR
ncbi:WXG100 family type VII secretion target [Actinoplanes sp. L3-i22]|uniref:WXG100 family type VII secretion target n=1 Tax=Actinoplanes sp. L3-i22 TaxID=2836373 RepID=UPI001C76A3A9|nr:hypothetical protein [Actinoplanes sp. L3-i22]BCY13410.1 hypothetical protein L3i22_084980 [Actinoplanes sp. L3-i22]